MGSRNSECTSTTQEATATRAAKARMWPARRMRRGRLEEHTSELQSLMRISYAVFCSKKIIRTIKNIPRKTSFHLHISYRNRLVTTQLTNAYITYTHPP